MIQAMFKEEIIETLRLQYNIEQKNLTYLNRGNNLKNLCTCTEIFEQVEAENEFTQDNVNDICDVAMLNIYPETAYDGFY